MLQAELQGQFVQEIRHALRMIVWNNPPAFRIWTRIRRRWNEYRVEPVTDLVIEGFPRSGNTFAFAAMRISQQQELKIAHHTHSPAKILLAHRCSIPALIITRNPMQAQPSYWLRNPELPVERLIHDFIDYHKRILPLHPFFLTVRFEDVFEKSDIVIERLNLRFSLNLQTFRSTPDVIDKCNKFIDELHRKHWNESSVNELKVARPTMAKVKVEIRSMLLKPPFHTLMRQAEATYHQFLATTYAIDN